MDEYLDVARTLRDDERSERLSQDDLRTHCAFMDIPVLTDATIEFAAVAFFDGGFEYVEGVDGFLIAIDVTPGEDGDDWNADELSNEEDLRDYVRVEASNDTKIESEDDNGVILRSQD